jgi:periplasmic protein TonB
MFERSMVVSQRSHASAQQRWTTAASITVQVAIVAVAAALPLFRQEMPALKVDAPKAFVQLRTPKPRLVRVETRATTRAASAVPTVPVQTQTAVLTAPPTIPTLINTAPDDGPPRIFTATGGSGVGTGLSQAVEVADNAPRVVAAAAKNDMPVHVSGGVQVGLLLAPIRPVYPAIAKVTHTQGMVVVEAIISKEGRIERLNVVSGPEMLRKAAMDAIQEARYRPYLLDGVPVDVQTTITVNFRMDG